MQGRIIRSPERWDKTSDPRKGIFLAGGITNCSQWQREVADTLAESLPIVVLDPRRDNWDMRNNHVESVVQIEWESKHLKKSDYIIFWFPATSDCPITLFELGCWLGKGANLMIGTDSDYRRRLDVEVQVALVDPKMKIWNDLNKMIDHFITTWK
jgi:hypothetical protein